jgi:hypothetical protein
MSQNGETVETLLIKIANTVVTEYYGAAKSKKLDEHADKFDSVYRKLHRSVTRARNHDYEGLDTPTETTEEGADDGQG